MYLRNALPELPQPIRNIYNDYQLIKNQSVVRQDKVDVIHRIAKDCFRLLLTIPLVILMRVGYTYSTNNMAGIISLGIFMISPASNMLVGAGFFSVVCISRVVSAVAERCFTHVGEAVFAALIAGLLSENYQRYNNTIIGLPERLLMVIPTKISDFISPVDVSEPEVEEDDSIFSQIKRPFSSVYHTFF